MDRNLIHKVLFIFLLAMLLLSFLFSPIFTVKDIEVVGNNIYSKEDIIKIVKLNENNNFFHLFFNNIDNILKRYNKIEDVKSHFIFPNKIVLEIIENPPIGYISYSDKYVYIDKKGVILEISEKSPLNLPIIKGLEVNEYKVNVQLEVMDKEIFSNINLLSTVMQKYNLLQKKIIIDVSNKENIHLYINNLDIKFGPLNDIDEKIRKIVGVLNHISEKDRGTLDLSAYKDKVVFSPIE